MQLQAALRTTLEQLKLTELLALGEQALVCRHERPHTYVEVNLLTP